IQCLMIDKFLPLRKQTRDDNSDGTEDEMEFIAIVSGFIMVVVGAWSDRFKHKDLPWNEHERAIKRAYWLDSLMNDRICKEQLRMDRRCFDKLCHVLVTRGGLVTTRNVTVLEVVAFFVHTLAHDLKNRTISVVFTRSGETVSRQFHIVLKAVMKIGKFYIKQLDSSVTYDGDSKWKWFEGSLGALDGTLIKKTVRVKDRPRYRDRKGDITTNVLVTCDPSLWFTYVLLGSASDPRILGDALRRPNSLKVLKDKVLGSIKGTHNHLNLWRGTNPTNYKELFNLRHSSTCNTIERAFGLLKKRWAILKKSSFYDKQTQVRIINACFVLHNFVREENLDEESLLYEVDNDLSNIVGVDTVMKNKRKEPMASTQAIKRGYVSWNKQMDDILTRVLLEEINKEKRDGEIKPQAYQAVVDELKKELGIAINVDHVRNRAKSWKKQYGEQECSPYRNKCIEIGKISIDRTVGDGSEQHDEAANVTEGEMGSEGRSSSKDPTNSGSHKRKKDSVAEAVNSFTDPAQARPARPLAISSQEIHAVVSQVFGISRSHIMRALKRFMNGNPDEFLMLKELLEDEKLEWVFLCLAE
ncbi:putative nuclease HARBI1, partial [Bienertia sinuspersici]